MNTKHNTDIGRELGGSGKLVGREKGGGSREGRGRRGIALLRTKKVQRNTHHNGYCTPQ